MTQDRTDLAAAKQQQYTMANTKQNMNLDLRNQTELNAQEYKYGTFKAAQAYEQESRFAVDEASRELKRQAAAGDINKIKLNLKVQKIVLH